MDVRDFARKAPVAVTPETTVREVARLMDDAVVGAVIVVDEGRPVGIVTDRDLVLRVVAPGLPLDSRVDDVMSDDLVVLEATSPAGDAVRLFEAHAIRRIPLVADGVLVAVLAVDDLLIDVISDLGALVRPITGQVIFGHPEAHAAVAESAPRSGT